MTKLSVNINKLATIRNSRGGNNPDVVQYATKIESYGAQGITIHPRPDQRHIRFEDVYVLTSNNGWDTKTQLDFLTGIIERFHQAGIRTSLFLNPDPDMLASAKATGTDRIELYTEAYASSYHSNRETAIAPYIKTAELANAMGLGINAGHDLDLHNLKYFADNIPGLLEVSIGHALICDALEFGMENTVRMYLNQLSK